MFVWLCFAASLSRELEERSDERGALLKIGFTSDWEYGYRDKIAHKLTNQAPVLLQEAVRFYNEELQPAFIVAGGDYIEGSSVSKTRAQAQLSEIIAVFRQVRAPHVFALGNHDLRALSKEEAKAILGQEEAHAVRDIGDWRLVVFDTNFNKNDDSDRGDADYTKGYVSRAELAWLDAALETDRPTIVFSHHSPLPTIAGDKDESFTENLSNGHAVRTLLERHPNVLFSVAGHTPRPQYKEISGVHYFVSDTLVNASSLGSFSAIELRYNPFSKKGTILFEHYGQDRQTYRAEAWTIKSHLANWWRMTKIVFSEKF